MEKLNEMGDQCEKVIKNNYFFSKREQSQRQFKDNLLSRKFNIHLSYLALNKDQKDKVTLI